MKTDTIRDTIALAKLHEKQHGHLIKLMNHHVPSNKHFSVRFPEKDAIANMVKFVIAYIEQVPDIIDAARAITKKAKIQEYAEPFFSLAEDYFLKLPEIITGDIGLINLIDEAYLAHRLIEEMNDRYMIRSSISLIPIDMTMTNLIIHRFIGEPFANELDEAVHYTAERTMLNENVCESDAFKAYVAEHKNNNWEKDLQQWPCLTDQLSINQYFSTM